MYVPYENMPMNARVWVYASPSIMNPDQVAKARVRLYDFCEEWKAHGQELQASFSILYDRFLILLVNEEQAKASGCSIDSSVHVIQELAKSLDIDFFDRMQVAFYNQENKLDGMHMSDFSDYLKTLNNPEKVVVFNTTVQDKKGLETDFEVPVKESWHKQLL